MAKQVKLTENELRQLIRESVHASLNEAGWGDRFRNLGNKFKNAFKRKNDDDDFYNYHEPISNDDMYEPVSIDDEEPRNETPYSYSQQPSQTIAPNPNNMDDWNEENYDNHDEEGESNGLFDQDEPRTIDSFTNIQPQQDEQPQNTQQQEEQPQNTQQQEEQPQNTQQQQAQPQQQEEPAQPQYQRGAKYHVNFTRENEEMFNQHITPTYNNLNNVIKSLGALRQIGEYNYNKASSIFNTWGQSNYNGGQQAFKAVCQQIDSIMPTLQNLKAEMKNVLKANGVRDTEDYQHYNMEEQRIRRIVSNSLQKILRESKRR